MTEGIPKRLNSKQKGKRGELELAHYLSDRGFPSRRGQQFSGGDESPDIIVESLPDIHFEVKRIEKSTGIYDWLAQAINDAGDKKMPVVVHRRSRQPWICVLQIDDFLKLVSK